MSLVDEAVLGLDHVPEFFGIAYAIDGAVRRAGLAEGLVGTTVHVPVDGLGKYQAPVASENDVGLFGGDEQKVAIGLGVACAVVVGEFLDAQLGGVAGVAFAGNMKVHDHGGVDPDGAHGGFERRLPEEAF